MAKLDLTKLKEKANGAPESSKGDGTVAAASGDKPAAGLAFLKSRSEPKQLEAESPAASVAPKAGGGLGFLKGRIATGGSAAGGGQPDSVAGGNAAQPAKPAAHAASDSAGSSGNGDSRPAGGAVADDLASLLDSESGSAAPVKSRFADEIPATAPVRDLPEGLEKQQLQFIESLDTVYKVMHEPDLLGGIIKSIMMELANNPEYRKLISPQDVHVMIRGMRDSMGMARIQKAEAKAKRSGGGRTKKAKVDDLDTLAALDEAFAGVEL